MQPTFFQTMRQKVSDFWARNKKRKRFWFGIVIGVIVALIVFINKPTTDDGSITTATRRDVAETIVLSGRTQSQSAVDLAFADSGRVSYVGVKEGDKVVAGQTLASLESGQLNADLVIARAGLTNTNNSLEKTIKEQDALVQNAYRKLLSDGLEAVPEDLTTTATAPTISGTYAGAEEGEYVITTYPSHAQSGNSFYVSGLESGPTGTVAEIAVPLGSKGLFISFDTDSSYGGTNWVVSIPNKRSSSYVTNYNAYQSALATRDRVIADAQADLATSGTQASIAQARVDSIVAQIAKRKITAPFSGTIARIDVKTGEIASATSGTITLISEADYEAILKVPEIDVAKLMIGQAVDIQLDAYSDTVFPGIISSINPGETVVDGVPVYETRVAFNDADERIRSGMTATATIIPHQVMGVIAIPKNFIHDDKAKGIQYVYVLDSEGKETEKRMITTGLKGSDSYVEITSGLNEGEKVSVDEVK